MEGLGGDKWCQEAYSDGLYGELHAELKLRGEVIRTVTDFGTSVLSLENGRQFALREVHILLKVAS